MTFRKGLDNLLQKDSMINGLNNAGFTKVNCRSVGEHVWTGFDRWSHQVKTPEKYPDSAVWLKIYQQHKIDYGIFTAVKQLPKF
jgi:hypothetical protein